MSYYDYYQPEAYLPSSDTYIEKDLSINEEIEKLRLSATSALLSGRRDVIVVSSVSCLYGIGNPADFHATSVHISTGEVISRKVFMYRLVEALYTRTESVLTPATFRVNGDVIDIMQAFGETTIRVMFFDDEIEQIQRIDAASGQRLEVLDEVTIFLLICSLRPKSVSIRPSSRFSSIWASASHFMSVRGARSRPNESSNVSSTTWR